MSNISKQELLAYFEARTNHYKNAKGMELGHTGGFSFYTNFVLIGNEPEYTYKPDQVFGPIAINITTEDEFAENFIEFYDLKSVDDVDKLNYTRAWMRYLNGNAAIHLTPMELEATISFKIVGRITIVYSLELHYYDEVDEHLTLEEDFEKYISSSEKNLYAAQQNRYKFGPPRKR